MAGNLAAKKSDFVTQWTNRVDTLLQTIAELDRMQLEAQVLDYATTIEDADLVDENDYLTKADLVASFQSVTAVEAFLAANSNEHFAAFYRVVR